MQWWRQPDLPITKELGIISACLVVNETANVVFCSLICHLMVRVLEDLMSSVSTVTMPTGCSKTDIPAG